MEKDQHLDKEQGAWELARTKVRDEERRNQLGAGGVNHPVGRRGAASKRLQEQGAQTPGRRKRARKYELIGEDWGMGSKDIREQLKEDNMAPQQEQEGALHTPNHTPQSAPYSTPTPPLEGADVQKEQHGAVAIVELEGTPLVPRSAPPPFQGLPQPTTPPSPLVSGQIREGGRAVAVSIPQPEITDPGVTFPLQVSPVEDVPGTARSLDDHEVGAEGMEKDVMMRDNDEIVPDLNRKEEHNSTTALPSSGGTMNRTRESCTFNKRGVCKSHKVLGVKTSSKKRIWTKKKFGWGWATVTSVSYTCLVEDESDYGATIIGDREVSCFPGVDNRVSNDLESSRSLVGPLISAATEVEDWKGPND